MPREDDRDYHNPNCINVVPLVLLLMPYALARFAVDGARRRWRHR
jgi:hypothetical protein